MAEGGRGAGLIRQSVFVVATVLMVVGGFVIAGILLADPDSVSSTSRNIVYGVLGILVFIVVVWQVRRRRNRQSLDDALRSRRR